MPKKTKSTYKEKLLDPRWQKKRLEVLERDGWKCYVCQDNETTLHVHHKYYSNGDPWDVPNTALVTLCAVCHEDETNLMPEMVAKMKTFLGDAGALAGEMDGLFHCFERYARSLPLNQTEWEELHDVLGEVLKARTLGGDLGGVMGAVVSYNNQVEGKQ